MSYQIRTGEGVRRAVLRMARKQLARAHAAAVDGERPTAARVHDVRAAIKKVRSLVTVAPSLRAGSEEDRRLAKIAGRLSELRDAEVVLTRLGELGPIGKDEGVAPVLRAFLQQRARRLDAEARLARAARSLARAERRARGWRVDRGGLDAIGEGLVSGYRAARDGMIAAYRDGGYDAFHAARKAVKRHAHQVRAFAPLWALEPGRLTELDRLAELLGTEHDFVAVEAIVREAGLLGDATRKELLLAAGERRAFLRVEAFVLGRRLFAARPRRIRKRLAMGFAGFRKSRQWRLAATRGSASVVAAAEAPATVRARQALH